MNKTQSMSRELMEGEACNLELTERCPNIPQRWQPFNSASCSASLYVAFSWSLLQNPLWHSIRQYMGWPPLTGFHSFFFLFFFFGTQIRWIEKSVLIRWLIHPFPLSGNAHLETWLQLALFDREVNHKELQRPPRWASGKHILSLNYLTNIFNTVFGVCIAPFYQL